MELSELGKNSQTTGCDLEKSAFLDTSEAKNLVKPKVFLSSEEGSM